MRSLFRPALLGVFVAGSEVVRFSAALAVEEVAPDVTPVGKVVELLGVLQRQLVEDNRADEVQHNNYTRWYGISSEEARRVAANSFAQINSVQALMDQGEAFRAGRQSDLERIAGEQAKAEADLKEATDRRERERNSFKSAEAQLTTAIDQFGRALEVLYKKAGNRAAAALLESGGDGGDGAAGAAGESGSPAAFLSVAKGLRSTLEQDTGFALTEGQRESLDGLVRIAAQRLADAASTPDARAPPATDFLQVKAMTGRRASADDGDLEIGPYDGYQSSSGGIIQTLQSVLSKTQQQLDQARRAEAVAQNQFEAFRNALQAEIKNKERSVADLKLALSRSQEQAGQLKSKLVALQQVLKVTQEERTQLEADNAMKIKAYKERRALRSDESLAVQDALRILQSQAAKTAFAPVPAADAAASFLQVGSRHGGRSACAVLRAAMKPPVSFLTLRTRAHRSRRRSADPLDPFAKVKNMVRAMLRKLSEEQAQQVKHASWCDSELTKSTKSKADREDDVERLKDRIEDMQAELTQLVGDIKKLNKDLSEMQSATNAATRLRTTESAQSKAALAQYRDAQQLIRNAIAVLTKFYEESAAAATPADTPAADGSGTSGFKANDMGSGVIGVLEVAQANYKTLDDELTLEEGTAAKDYADLMSEAEVRQAVFKKDLEYKNRAKVKLEGDVLRAGSDLKSYQKELDAVVSYLAQLQSTCTIKGDSYDERRSRRDKELSSLRQALQYLSGTGLPP